MRAAVKVVDENSLTHPVQLAEGECVVVQHRTADPEAMRAAIDRAIERMHADKRKGDAVKFLRVFRDNPRA